MLLERKFHSTFHCFPYLCAKRYWNISRERTNFGRETRKSKGKLHRCRCSRSRRNEEKKLKSILLFFWRMSFPHFLNFTVISTRNETGSVWGCRLEHSASRFQSLSHLSTQRVWRRRWKKGSKNPSTRIATRESHQTLGVFRKSGFFMCAARSFLEMMCRSRSILDFSLKLIQTLLRFHSSLPYRCCCR